MMLPFLIAIPILLTFTDQVSFTTVLVIIGAVLGIWVTVRSGGPWRALAEGYKEERNELQAEAKDLHHRIGELESRPDMQTIAGAIKDVVTLLQGMQETQGMILHILAERDPEARTRATDSKGGDS